MNEILQNGLVDIIQLLVAVVLAFASVFLKKKLKELKYLDAYDEVMRLVYKAEDIILGPEMGEERKLWVLEQASLFMKKHKINLSAEEIKGILEETVSLINIIRDEIEKKNLNS